MAVCGEGRWYLGKFVSTEQSQRELETGNHLALV